MNAYQAFRQPEGRQLVSQSASQCISAFQINLKSENKVFFSHKQTHIQIVIHIHTHNTKPTYDSITENK